MKKIFVSGNFNVLHPGHLRLFRFARELGDKLIVGVNSDKVGGENVHVHQKLRLEGINSNNLVDESYLITKSLEKTISLLKPNIIVKGKEHENNYNIEKKILKKYGGRLVFCSGEVGLSSSDLIFKNFNYEEINRKYFPKDYVNRHKIKSKDINKVIDKFKSKKVIVIGDLIVDEHIDCNPLGMSHEDSSVVLTPVDTKKYIGGAGIVAAHAAALGSNVNFISVVGKDDMSKFSKDKLKEYNVKSFLLTDVSRPTTLKQRFKIQNKTMMKVSHLHTHSISLELQDNIYNFLSKKIKNCDLLVFSDFNYGCLPQRLVDKIISKAKEFNVMMIADSQSSSQFGDVSRFKDMYLITCTEHEARVSLHDQESGLIIMAEKLRKKSCAKNIIIKLAEEGALLHFSNNSKIQYKTDRVPALNPSPVDISGAGDSMLIASGLTLASNGNVWMSAAVGSIAASIQVSKSGNYPISYKDLIKHLE